MIHFIIRIRNSVLLTAVFSVLLFSCVNLIDKTPDVEKELKVMVWNIWHGGHSDSLPRDGRQDVISVINKSGADVVLMIETYGSAPEIAAGTGMDFAIYSVKEDDRWENLCIFSRYPIIKRERHAQNRFNFISAVIDVEGTPVRLADVWLDYLPSTSGADLTAPEASIQEWERTEGDRIPVMKRILSLLDDEILGADDVPLIMGGDFNSHSHLDWVESTADLAPYDHGGRQIQWEVSSLMTGAGFIDSWREIHPDPAVQYGVTWLADYQPCRIDYIYYKGSKLQAVDSETVNAPYGSDFTFRGEELMYPSDHGLVLTTFKINGSGR